MSRGQLIFGKDDNKNASIQILFPELNKMTKGKKNIMYVNIYFPQTSSYCQPNTARTEEQCLNQVQAGRK